MIRAEFWWGDDSDRKPGDPSILEISERVRQIQSGWTDEEREKRQHGGTQAQRRKATKLTPQAYVSAHSSGALAGFVPE